MPNSSSEVRTNTAEAHFAGAPSARTMSTMPATIATGKVPAWIQPRQVGFDLEPSRTAIASSEREVRQVGRGLVA